MPRYHGSRSGSATSRTSAAREAATAGLVRRAGVQGGALPSADGETRRNVLTEIEEIQAFPGTRYDERRQWLLPQGLIARNLSEHVLFPRPKKNATGRSFAVAFDELAGNTMLGMHMSRMEPGAHNRGHRHVDEAIIMVVAGQGWSELRQSDEQKLQRIEWSAGDLFAVPANAWHQHFNGSDTEPTRQLAFKNTSLLRTLFGSRAFVYDNAFRFDDRYNDQDDYWTSRRTAQSGVIHTNAIHDLRGQPLPAAPELGDNVSAQRYRLGGHRTLEVDLIELGSSASITRRRSLAEEAFYVLAGQGRTTITDDDGRQVTFRWQAGDLFSPPFHSDREHAADSEGPARLLRVRNSAFERALGIDDSAPEGQLPNRFTDMVEPDYS